MKLKTLGAAAAGFAAIALFAGIASAQTANTVNVTTSNPSSTPVAGTTATLATVRLSGTNGGTYLISSIPVMLTASNGAAASYLSNCQVMNGSAALNTGGNIPTIQSGSNTFTFDTPFTIPANTTENLTIQCAISSASPANATYQLTASTPTISSVTGATTGGAALGVMLAPISSVPAGTQNAVLALITLDGSNSNQTVNISSIPISLAFTGASAGNYSNCALRNPTNLASALNTGVNAISTPANGNNSFLLDTPISLSAGSAEILALTCNVSASAASGSTIGVSLVPATVVASGITTGSFNPTTDMTSSGTPAQTSGTILITAPAIATTGTTGTGGTTTTPGTPNTGAGGNAPLNILVLALSALAAAGGAVLLLKRQTR